MISFAKKHEKDIVAHILIAIFLLANIPAYYSQSKQRRASFKFEDYKLYTFVKGRKYFIDAIQHKGAVNVSDPVFDPTNRYIFYVSNTGCGFEGDGMTIFISDVYGKRKYPILGRCEHLDPIKFVKSDGKYYLLIKQSNEASEDSFWLYDVSAKEFVLHAIGELKAIGNGSSYRYYKNAAELKYTGKVTTRDLINRQSPLKLLPRRPTHGFTRRKNTRLLLSDNEGCTYIGGNEFKVIPSPGTKVLILEECEDGGYLIYYNGAKGKVQAKNLIPIK